VPLVAQCPVDRSGSASILARHVLPRGSFTSTDDLAAKLDAYVAWYRQHDRPFRWSYRPKSWSESRSFRRAA
jgi:hypothetical protein